MLMQGVASQVGYITGKSLDIWRLPPDVVLRRLLPGGEFNHHIDDVGVRMNVAHKIHRSQVWRHVRLQWYLAFNCHCLTYGCVFSFGGSSRFLGFEGGCRLDVIGSRPKKKLSVLEHMIIGPKPWSCRIAHVRQLDVGRIIGTLQHSIVIRTRLPPCR